MTFSALKVLRFFADTLTVENKENKYAIEDCITDEIISFSSFSRLSFSLSPSFSSSFYPWVALPAAQMLNDQFLQATLGKQDYRENWR